MNFRSFSVVPILVLVALVFSNGCSRYVNVAQPAESRANPNVIEDRRVERDGSLRRTARIIEIVEGQTHDGFLRVQMRVQNGRRTPRSFLYQWVWVDHDGIEIRSPLSDWREVRMQGYEEKRLVGIAHTKDAADFQIKMIEPRK